MNRQIKPGSNPPFALGIAVILTGIIAFNVFPVHGQNPSQIIQRTLEDLPTGLPKGLGKAIADIFNKEWQDAQKERKQPTPVSTGTRTEGQVDTPTIQLHACCCTIRPSSLIVRGGVASVILAYEAKLPPNASGELYRKNRLKYKKPGDSFFVVYYDLGQQGPLPFASTMEDTFELLIPKDAFTTGVWQLESTLEFSNWPNSSVTKSFNFQVIEKGAEGLEVVELKLKE